jgi:hypothetical protein
MREVRRRGTSRTDAPRAPRDAVREVRRRGTSCTGSLGGRADALEVRADAVRVRRDANETGRARRVHDGATQQTRRTMGKGQRAAIRGDATGAVITPTCQDKPRKPTWRHAPSSLRP